jgi:S-adenosylmethionine decarboxylase
MKALGRQLLVELHECAESVLDDAEAVEELMLSAARAAGATIVGQSFHRFAPHGVSGVVIIGESHLSLHTWPEFGYAAFDIFTCGDSVDPEAAVLQVRRGLGAQRHTVVEMRRGLLDLPDEQVRHKRDA